MSPLSRRIYAIAAIVLAAIIFVAVNIAADASLTTERLDLTENGAYSLADGTKHILSNLREPVTLRFFFSKKAASEYAQINDYASRVRDLLREYQARAHGMIILEEIDPEPYTPAEDQATSAGLTGAPTDSGDLVYFGLVGTNTIDGKEVIPFFAQDREPYLEYDLSSLVYRLATPKKPTIGIISSLPLEQGPGGMMAALQGRAQPFMIYEELSQIYQTRTLEANFESIPRDVDVLMIVHPTRLSPQQEYAIDQFVLRGGRALVFVDPMSELAGQSQGMMGGSSGISSSDLPQLFKAWGIGFNPDKLVGDRDLAQRVQTSADPRNPVVSYPIWLHLGSANFDGKDQVTASLQSLNLASVGALFHVAHASTTFAPLVTSSNEASLLDAPVVKLTTRPEDLMAQVEPTGERYVIAARVSGPAKTAFPAGPPGLSADALKKAPPQTKSSASPINVIVMADSDIFDDRFWVRVQNVLGRRMAAPFADNAAFVLNAVENLTGSNDLISLRTRATSNRPFVVVQKLQAKAQAQFQQEAEALQQQLTDTQTRLRALEQGGQANQAGNSVTLSPQQQEEIQAFKRQLIVTRAQLREVQHNLRKDIDALGSLLAFINIALMPILVAISAVVVALARRRRRARALAI